MDKLGVSEDVLRSYVEHGVSVLPANLIHITRHLLCSLTEGTNRDLARESLSILPFISKFDVLNTLLALQHDFCTLWDSVIHQAWKGRAEDNSFFEIVLEIDDDILC